MDQLRLFAEDTVFEHGRENVDVRAEVRVLGRRSALPRGLSARKVPHVLVNRTLGARVPGPADLLAMEATISA